MAEHGGLEIPLIDAAADEHTEETAQEPMHQGQEHLAQSERTSTARQTARSGADRVSLPHRHYLNRCTLHGSEAASGIESWLSCFRAQQAVIRNPNPAPVSRPIRPPPRSA